MATNTLANLRACVKEFDTEESSDLQNIAKRFEAWVENFEACVEFEEVTEARKNPALLPLGGGKLRELCKTLGITAQDSYTESKTKLTTHYTPKKNLSAESFKFLNMRPETPQ